ncbi:unnamed protein product [Meganyctiphanes norvegica]|uniref:Uncharacterized protein n=1 Tax=Meganyctiphanes norvegica TaxID=48144 RepID=A0AAV2Q5B5_MEGNR
MPGYHVPNMNYIPEGPHMGHVLKGGPDYPHKKDKKAPKVDQVRKIHPMLEAHRYHPGVPSYPGAYGYPRPVGHPMGYPGYGTPAGGYMGYDSHHLHAMRDHDKKHSHKFDSTQLLGNENDSSYLDKFMSHSKSLSRDGKHKDSDSNRHRHKSVTSSAPTSERSSGIKNSRSRSSLNLDSVAKTLLNTMRSAASDEEIYESMEIVQYRKTLEAITKRDQTANVKKSKHPLFDHLRTERALKDHLRADSRAESRQSNTLPLPRERALSPQSRNPEPLPGNQKPIWPTTGPLSKHPAARRGDHMHTSDGNSSGSGDDEFDYKPRPNHRFSRSAVLNTRRSDGNRQEDSDEEGWGIPRPSFGSGGDRTRRSGAVGVRHQRQVSTDESDSSSKSTGLR